jgi:hypothetical protein
MVAKEMFTEPTIIFKILAGFIHVVVPGLTDTIFDTLTITGDHADRNDLFAAAIDVLSNYFNQTVIQQFKSQAFKYYVISLVGISSIPMHFLPMITSLYVRSERETHNAHPAIIALGDALSVLPQISDLVEMKSFEILLSKRINLATALTKLFLRDDLIFPPKRDPVVQLVVRSFGPLPVPVVRSFGPLPPTVAAKVSEALRSNEAGDKEAAADLSPYNGDTDDEDHGSRERSEGPNRELRERSEGPQTSIHNPSPMASSIVSIPELEAKATMATGPVKGPAGFPLNLFKNPYYGSSQYTQRLLDRCPVKLTLSNLPEDLSTDAVGMQCLKMRDGVYAQCTYHMLHKCIWFQCTSKTDRPETLGCPEHLDRLVAIIAKDSDIFKFKYPRKVAAYKASLAAQAGPADQPQESAPHVPSPKVAKKAKGDGPAGLPANLFKHPLSHCRYTQDPVERCIVTIKSDDDLPRDMTRKAIGMQCFKARNESKFYCIFHRPRRCDWTRGEEHCEAVIKPREQKCPKHGLRLQTEGPKHDLRLQTEGLKYSIANSVSAEVEKKVSPEAQRPLGPAKFPKDLFLHPECNYYTQNPKIRCPVVLTLSNLPTDLSPKAIGLQCLKARQHGYRFCPYHKPRICSERNCYTYIQPREMYCSKHTVKANSSSQNHLLLSKKHSAPTSPANRDAPY